MSKDKLKCTAFTPTTDAAHDNNSIIAAEEKSEALRVMIAVYKGVDSFWEQAWNKTEEILPYIILMLEHHQLLPHRPVQDLLYKILVKKKFTTMIRIIVDIYDKEYNAATAHLPKNNRLPVAVVIHNRFAGLAPPKLQGEVNREVMEAHMVGSSDTKTPFETDYRHPDRIPTTQADMVIEIELAKFGLKGQSRNVILPLLKPLHRLLRFRTRKLAGNKDHFIE